MHLSILICLISWSVLNAAIVKFGFDVIGNTALDSHGVHPPYVLGWLKNSSVKTEQVRRVHDAQVLCQRATQLDSGSMTAMIPSKYVVVQMAMRSGELFIWRGEQ